MRKYQYILSMVAILATITELGGVADTATPLSVSPPAGWAAVDSVRVYGTTENPGPDGTIFDYMNGGGLVWLTHGFVRMYHLACVHPDGVQATIDIFDLGTPSQATSAFDDEDICPPDQIDCDIGVPCKAYRYPPDFFLYAQQDRFLIYTGVASDSLSTGLIEYIRHLADTISGG